MAEVKVMVVPGRIARVDLTAGMTVLGACEAAERQIPGVGWTELAKTREVRVQNRRFSNSAEVAAGCCGSIQTTPLSDGDVVLILTKIKGNGSPGLGVLTVVVDGQEYALETPERIDVVLANVVGYDITEIKTMLVNGEDSPCDQLVGAGDFIIVKFYGDGIDNLYRHALDDEEEEEKEEEELDLPPLPSPEEEPAEYYLLSTTAPTPEPEAATSAELDPDELEDKAKRLQAQAHALTNLAQALRRVKEAKAKLAELGYEV